MRLIAVARANAAGARQPTQSFSTMASSLNASSIRILGEAHTVLRPGGPPGVSEGLQSRQRSEAGQLPIRRDLLASCALR